MEREKRVDIQATKGKETVQTDQYYISSGDFTVEEFLNYIRGHWSIENQLHWMLNIVFREDECRVRTGNAALNLNILRKMTLHRLKKMKMEKKRVSAKRRMIHAALGDGAGGLLFRAFSSMLIKDQGL